MRNGNIKKSAAAWILVLLMAVISAAALTGCSSEPKTLEEYLSENAGAAQEIEESLSGLENDDMGLNIEYKKNKVIITCEMKTTYEEPVVSTLKKVYSEQVEKELGPALEEAAREIESETGIQGVSIDMLINNGDGSELWKGTYPAQTDAGGEEDGEDSAEETETEKDE